MTLARELAMRLECRVEKEKRPCHECAACQQIALDKYCDVQVLRLTQTSETESGKGRTEIGIDQIKDLLHSANLPPFAGDYRLYIIDEADNLSADAAHRLLKTLEEPPKKVVFLLLAESATAIPATVISRCQRLNLARVKTAEIEALLLTRRLDPEKARLLARLSGGRPGWALEAAENPAFQEERREKFARMAALLAGDISDRFNVANLLALQFSKKRDVVYETLDTWSGWWRDILLVKIGSNTDIISIDNESTLVEMAGSYTVEQIKTTIANILECQTQLKLNANARLALEVLMLNLPQRNRQKAGAAFREENA